MGLGLRFVWDSRKATINLRKHGVPFGEASSVFGDRLARVRDDPDHSDTEERYLIIGLSERNRLLVVVFADDEDNIRLISARQATNPERKQYEDSYKR